MNRDYRKIRAWQLADDLAVAVYEKSRGFPREELYGLTAQMRRAVVSVAANIAEGASRDSKRDYLRFLYIAKGSLSEARYYLHLARRLAYLSDSRELEELCDQTAATLLGLIEAVRKEAGSISRTVALVSSSLMIYGTRGIL